MNITYNNIIIAEDGGKEGREEFIFEIKVRINRILMRENKKTDNASVKKKDKDLFLKFGFKVSGGNLSTTYALFIDILAELMF